MVPNEFSEYITNMYKCQGQHRILPPGCSRRGFVNKITIIHKLELSYNAARGKNMNFCNIYQKSILAICKVVAIGALEIRMYAVRNNCLK